jgi:hypothetical protein
MHNPYAMISVKRLPVDVKAALAAGEAPRLAASA